MTYSVSNYDGGYTASPRQLVYAETVEQIQAILKDSERYPSPVRAMGSYHSLTPCVSTDGTVVNMSRMKRVISIDHEKRTLTAQAGLQIIEASEALWPQGFQLHTNVEIGNMTLGSAASCHSKDALDGDEFGQVGSYVSKVKWVSPSGELMEADEEHNPELLRLMRSSYGLAGIVYEVTIRIEPIEAAELMYFPRPIDDITEEEVSRFAAESEGLVCWVVGRTAVFQTRRTIAKPGMFAAASAEARHLLWNHIIAFIGRAIERSFSGRYRDLALRADFAGIKLFYAFLNAIGGVKVWDPAKIVDYRRTGPASRYLFTFWTFPQERWLSVLKDYLEFTDDHHEKYGFRCNMPFGAYRIHQDKSSLLSYTHDGETISLDPIHAPWDRPAWERFATEFNEFATKRDGIPLLNQSPLITRAHVEHAYGARWRQFSDWVRAVDPGGRMMNPFFRELLSEPVESLSPDATP